MSLLHERVSEPVPGSPGKFTYKGKEGVWRRIGNKNTFFADDGDIFGAPESVKANLTKARDEAGRKLPAGKSAQSFGDPMNAMSIKLTDLEGSLSKQPKLKGIPLKHWAPPISREELGQAVKPLRKALLAAKNAPQSKPAQEAVKKEATGFGRFIGGALRKAASALKSVFEPGKIAAAGVQVADIANRLTTNKTDAKKQLKATVKKLKQQARDYQNAPEDKRKALLKDAEESGRALATAMRDTAKEIARNAALSPLRWLRRALLGEGVTSADPCVLEAATRGMVSQLLLLEECAPSLDQLVRQAVQEGVTAAFGASPAVLTSHEHSKRCYRDRPCPDCGACSIQSCRCFRSESKCENGHEWHFCLQHRSAVRGWAPHNLKGCTCQPQESLSEGTTAPARQAQAPEELDQDEQAALLFASKQTHPDKTLLWLTVGEPGFWASEARTLLELGLVDFKTDPSLVSNPKQRPAIALARITRKGQTWARLLRMAERRGDKFTLPEGAQQPHLAVIFEATTKGTEKDAKSKEDCHWVTVGKKRTVNAATGGQLKHKKGGSRVCLGGDGEIEKGAKELKGKDIDELDKDASSKDDDKKDNAKKAPKDAEPFDPFAPWTGDSSTPWVTDEDKEAAKTAEAQAAADKHQKKIDAYRDSHTKRAVPIKEPLDGTGEGERKLNALMKSIVYSDVTKEQSDALKSWSGGGYSHVRDYQRTGKPKAYKEETEILDKFLATAPTAPGTTYRGLTVSSAVAKRIMEQDVHSFDATTSTSRSEETGTGFSNCSGVEMDDCASIVLVMDQVSGVDIEPISSVPGEQETLMRKGAKFMKTKMERKTVNGEEKVYIHLAEIGGE